MVTRGSRNQHGDDQNADFKSLKWHWFVTSFFYMETKERELEKPAFKFVFTTGDFSESHKHGVIVAINLNHSVIPSG